MPEAQNREIQTHEPPHAEPQRPAHILVVDDDAGFREQVSAYLADRGFIVDRADDGAQMDRILSGDAVDVVVLDLMLPGEDGLSICRRLAAGRGPAVVIHSAMGQETDRIVGLELGADDYIGKPCNPRELLARVRAVLRRRKEGSAEAAADRGAYVFAGIRLDVSRRRLRAPSGLVVLLTAGELSLLMAFLARPRVILSRDALIEHAHGADADIFDRAIDVQISRLRRKLQACVDRDLIATYRGAGYLFDAAPARR
jgi:two-component system OmpR family response regulator